jgi:release factor glutamine methyltransferase
VYPAQRDTWLLAEALRREPRMVGARVLDLGTGSGALAVAAARAGAAHVTAVDISRQALATTWVNARCRGLRVRVRRGDMVQPVLEERFDVIVSNPPYVPSEHDRLPARGLDRCYDGGIDGRAVLDRVCTGAPKVLAPGGVFLVVHSAVCGVSATLAHLTADGLDASVVARCDHEFGPVLSARAELLASRGLIAEGQRSEELVVVRAVRPR